MTVLQKFHWTWPKDVVPVEFDDWIDALPEPDKSECIEGMRRQHEMRQQAINRGDMIMTNEGYIWKDSKTAKQGKGIDEVWEKYWLRWQAETGAKFSMTFEEK